MRYGCAFGGSNRFAETKRVGFYCFPALAEGRRRKGPRQSSKASGLHQNIRECAVIALLQVSHFSSACSVRPIERLH